MEILILAAILGLIPGVIAEKKGYNAFIWWLFGTALFILALPISLILTPKPKAIEKKLRDEGRVPCPSCAEFILPAASVCPFCQKPVK